MTRTIYVNGDSFTQGCELEYSLCPGYENSRELPATLDVKAIREESDKIIGYLHYHCIDTRAHIEKYRWSTILGEITGHNVINMSSLGGSSMKAIAYRTMQDLHDLEQQGIKVDDVIIQLTSQSRYEIYYNDVEFLEESLPGIDVLITPKYKMHSVSGDIVNEVFTDLHMALSDNTTDFIRFIECIMLLDSYISNRYNITPIFVDSVFHKNKTLQQHIFGKKGSGIMSYSDLDLPDFIKQYCEEHSQRLELAMDDNISPYDKVWTIGNHLDMSIHEKFAHSVAQRYFNE